MAKTLILMRHAKSSWDHPGVPDHDRPLNPRGVAAAGAMGDWLRDQGHSPDHIVSSTAERTRETAQRLRFDCSCAVTQTLYHAAPGQILSTIQAKSADVLLVLGHNPGIGDLAQSLPSRLPQHPKFPQFPTCATLIIDFDSASWSNVRPGTGTVVDFMVPRDLDAG